MSNPRATLDTILDQYDLHAAPASEGDADPAARTVIRTVAADLNVALLIWLPRITDLDDILFPGRVTVTVTGLHADSYVEPALGISVGARPKPGRTPGTPVWTKTFDTVDELHAALTYARPLLADALATRIAAAITTPNAAPQRQYELHVVDDPDASKPAIFDQTTFNALIEAGLDRVTLAPETLESTVTHLDDSDTSTVDDGALVEFASLTTTVPLLRSPARHRPRHARRARLPRHHRRLDAPTTALASRTAIITVRRTV